MRYPIAVAASIFSVALYFTLFWGFQGLWSLTSPLYGLEDTWRSQTVFWFARQLAFGPGALLYLAAFFGLFKLCVAAVLSVYVVDRIRCLPDNTADADILEIGMLLVVVGSIVTVAPAIWENDAGMIRANTMHLMLAGVAVALSGLERMNAEPRKDLVPSNRLAAVLGLPQTAPQDHLPRTGWYRPWRR